MNSDNPSQPLPRYVDFVYDNPGSDNIFDPGPDPGQGKPPSVNGVRTEFVEQLEAKVVDLRARSGIEDLTLEAATGRFAGGMWQIDTASAQPFLGPMTFYTLRRCVDFALDLFEESMLRMREETNDDPYF